MSAVSCVSAADCDSISSEIIGDSPQGEMSEIYVSADASDESGDGSSQNPFKSLECAVNNSGNGSTIHLNDGVYAGEKNRNINIEKSITIIGKSTKNTIIDGESCGRLFNLTSKSSLTLINITLMNGYSTENGGSIYCEGGEINIKNCILKNSKTTSDGGVIYNYMGALNIEDSLFINNTAFQYGGVLYTAGTTSIKNSDFTENTVTSQKAVGACIATGGKIDLDGCSFYNCFSPYSAGAILNIGNATVNNCRFERLSTNYTAGAISNHKYMLINNTYFGYNDVKYYAAAILAPPSGQYVLTEVYNSIFEKNHAGYHGSVSNNYPNTELHIQNCAFLDNYLKSDKDLKERYGDISLDDNATALYCWWGQNEINPDYYSPHSGEKAPEKINASRWLVMTFTSDSGAIYKDEINRLTVSLKNYFDNETKEIHEYEGEFDLPLDVTFYTDYGTLAKKKLVNGTATIDFNPQGKVNAVYAKINDQIVRIGDFQLRKTEIIAKGLEKDYGDTSKLVIWLVKENNTPISNKWVTVSLGGMEYQVKTDGNGKAKLAINSKPKEYTAKITFVDNDYQKSKKWVSVVVKKATPKVIATKQVFKKSMKTKKYTVAFKTNMNKAMKHTGVYLKVKGKTYYAKTDSRGHATFKITNLNKKGIFVAIVKYAGSKYYNAVKVKSNIIVK